MYGFRQGQSQSPLAFDNPAAGCHQPVNHQHLVQLAPDQRLFAAADIDVFHVRARSQGLNHTARLGPTR
jgi:hypothetical protein